MATRFMGGSGNRKGGRNLQRDGSSRRGGGRGRGDAEDETTIPVLDYACGYHDRFGKRHFLMPKYYRVQGGSCMDPSDNQTGYGLSEAARLKWPALFIEREDPDNVDRLCERLQREISQIRRRLARDMQLYIVKKDAQKNRTEPNVAAIKGIMEDPELVSDAELSDYSDSEIFRVFRISRGGLRLLGLLRGALRVSPFVVVRRTAQCLGVLRTVDHVLFLLVVPAAAEGLELYASDVYQNVLNVFGSSL
ncbi:hypothetical protein TEA_014989 [Camellia sinensis var. sinensis]|uniref:Uncharacterized protein n=1 Tax=Camellia sinensis var. sinensis TaxID=542762 RepID=A0A4S4EKW4_CAMSN|nr:hypothetical protein TEA_014989 [Camellia sinensis var. sinensis]